MNKSKLARRTRKERKSWSEDRKPGLSYFISTSLALDLQFENFILDIHIISGEWSTQLQSLLHHSSWPNYRLKLCNSCDRNFPEIKSSTELKWINFSSYWRARDAGKSGFSGDFCFIVYSTKFLCGFLALFRNVNLCKLSIVFDTVSALNRLITKVSNFYVSDCAFVVTLNAI